MSMDFNSLKNVKHLSSSRFYCSMKGKSKKQFYLYISKKAIFLYKRSERGENL